MPMSPDTAAEAARRRAELVEMVANVDEQLGELFLMEEPIDEHTLREAVRRATVRRRPDKFTYPATKGIIMQANYRTQQYYHDVRGECSVCFLTFLSGDINPSHYNILPLVHELSAESVNRMCATLQVSLAFVPIFMGSAYKNKGVQLLLDGVTDYLPSPGEVSNTALVRRTRISES